MSEMESELIDDISPEAVELFFGFCERTILRPINKKASVISLKELSRMYRPIHIPEIKPLLDELERRRVIMGHVVVTLTVSKTPNDLLNDKYPTKSVRLRLAPRGKALFKYYVALENL